MPHICTQKIILKMKKIILVTCVLIASFISANAQVDPNAIGLRFGGGDNSGVEISYQHGLSDVNRLELDLGYGFSSNYDQFKISGIYQWVFGIEDGFSWYVGPGASFGFYTYDNGYNGNDSEFYLQALGQVGLEYKFDFPLQLSVDFRPGVEIVPDLGDIHGSIAFSARYVFGSK
jgi:hypothetical protein